jgi:hypothetical protein
LYIFTVHFSRRRNEEIEPMKQTKTSWETLRFIGF